MTLKPYFQLVRLPNLFTAAADPIAGAILAVGATVSPRRWLPLALASAAIYAAGIVLNDVFDYEIDKRERPNRPLPSGRVSRRFAAWLGSLLMIGGVALAAVPGERPPLFVALALASAVLVYDVWARKTVLGPEVMGLCRGLNLALGLSLDPGFGGPSALMAAGAFGLFVVGLTWISRSEVEEGRSRGVAAGMVIQDLAILGLFAAILRAATFPGAGSERPILPLEGLLVLGMVALIVNARVGRAWVEPTPKTIQMAVKTGVLSLVWLDVGLVAGVRGPGPALGIAALWLPAFVLGKWLYST